MASPWLAGTPVALVGGTQGRAGSAVRDALLDAGAAVATVGLEAPVPPGTRWVVDLAGVSVGSAGRSAGTRQDDDDGDGEPGLGPDSVVLVTGGGRGIGARAAIGLARAFGCGIELVGRSPLRPDGEPSHLPGRDDTVAARLAIISRGELGRPGGIAVERDRILAAREIRRTLADLTEHAAFASYRALDVRDATALAAAIDDIRSQRGRLDGVVHVSEVLSPGRRGVTARGADPAVVGAARPAPGEVA
jgi:KR domain